jgi:hypothetical protein
MPEDVLDYQESVLQMVNSLSKGGMPQEIKKILDLRKQVLV